MKLAIVSLKSASTKQILNEATRYFDKVDLCHIKKVRLEANSDLDVVCEGAKLSDYDAVHLRGSFRYDIFLYSIAKILEKKGVYIGADPSFFKIAHHKFLTSIVLARHNIPIPKTYLSNTVGAAKEILNETIYPIVIKLPGGTHGKGVMFADSRSNASAILDTLEILKQPILIQEYLDCDGEDIRAIVVGDKVVAAMKRIAELGGKKSNIHAGGRGEPVSVTKELEEVAVAAAKALGADVCAVDLIEHIKGYKVIEVNVSAGLQGITEATKINVAGKIAEFIYNQTKKKKSVADEKTYTKLSKELGLKTKEDRLGRSLYSLEASFAGSKLVIPDSISKYLKVKKGEELYFKVGKNRIEVINPRKE